MDWSLGVFLRRKTKITASWENRSSFEPLPFVAVSRVACTSLCAPCARITPPTTLRLSLLGIARIQSRPSFTRHQKWSKIAFRNHFGCMNPRCNRTCTSFDVDHVNWNMKTSKYSLLISNRKIPPSVYQLCRELTMTQSFCVTCHRMKSGLPCLRFFTAAAPAGPHLAMAGIIQALLNEQIELRFLVEQKCAVDAMQSLRRQQPCGVVEEYFSSRRKASEADKTSPLHFSVLCPELAANNALPLLALKALILSGEKTTLPGLRCISSSISLSLSPILCHLQSCIQRRMYTGSAQAVPRVQLVQVSQFTNF